MYNIYIYYILYYILFVFVILQIKYIVSNELGSSNQSPSKTKHKGIKLILVILNNQYNCWVDTYDVVMNRFELNLTDL
jgi:hypothetical protein